MQRLLVSAAQIESAIGDIGSNAARMESLLVQASEARSNLVFFPECCLTGYDMEQAERIAIEPDDPQVIAIEEKACSADIAIGYGYIERSIADNRLFATYVVTSRESRLVYRKTHLGSREQKVLSPGDTLPIADVSGVKIGVQLCWEAHIPELTGTLRAKGAQLVLMPHAGGLAGVRRIESWSRYLCARALDNGLFVAACNAIRRNHDGSIHGGGIAFYGPDGHGIAQYCEQDEHIETVAVGGFLPREGDSSDMHAISYFDRRRPELYA